MHFCGKRGIEKRVLQSQEEEQKEIFGFQYRMSADDPKGPCINCHGCSKHIGKDEERI